MTKDEVMSMAQACWPSDRRMWSVDADLPRLERFAALVAEAERARCAAICNSLADDEGKSMHYRAGARWCAELIKNEGAEK
jgi:hypothetical protein